VRGGVEERERGADCTPTSAPCPHHG
jgi:hypothetical protein